jgi:hypothetical protein
MWEAKKAYDLINNHLMMVALKVCAKREAFDQYMWRMISMRLILTKLQTLRFLHFFRAIISGSLEIWGDDLLTEAWGGDRRL